MRRPDISKGLIHLTSRQTNKSAFDVLCEILTSAKLLGSGRKGFVKGKTQALCFSEAPLSAVPHLIAESERRSTESTNKNKKPPYSHYGLVFNKQKIFDEGGRPVIYLPDNEADWIPEAEKWRVVRYEPPGCDWTHEREWRLKGREHDLTALGGFYVLVKNKNEAKQVEQIESNAMKKVLGVIPIQNLLKFL